MADSLPVAERWFTTSRIDDSITKIREPYVDPLLRANTWHVRGKDRDVLIDTGLGVASLREALPELFSDREPVVVLTHAHLDHMGSAHEFTGRWAHAAEPTNVPGRGSLLGPELARLVGLGPADADQLPPVLLTALPSSSYDPAAYRLRPVEVTRFLDDGDSIDLGDRVLDVLHLPGHSPGSLGLYDRTSRTLFSGDVVYDDELLDDLVGSDRAQYAATMRRLRSLDVATVHSGHGPSFGGPRLRQLIDAYLARS